MSFIPCLVRAVASSGEMRYALGHPLLDRYLEFVAGRARPNTLWAVAFDLKTFFAVVGKDPASVEPADVFEFLAHQRSDRRVVRHGGSRVGPVSADDRPPVVVGVGLPRVLDRPRGHAGADQPGAARAVDDTSGWLETVAHGAAGACAAHAAQDPRPGSGDRTVVGAAHPS